MQTGCIILSHYFQSNTSRILLLSLLSLGYGSSDNTISLNHDISFSSSSSTFQLFNKKLVFIACSALVMSADTNVFSYGFVWQRIKDFESILVLISLLLKWIKRGLCFYLFSPNTKQFDDFNIQVKSIPAKVTNVCRFSPTAWSSVF